MSHPWISRKVTKKIYESILAQSEGVQIYLIKAGAGAGKTYLARDLGVKLGSETGYEAGQHKNIHWSGILDLYDPDTNNNSGIEKLLIQAFSDHPDADFQEYKRARKAYAIMSKGGSAGGNLEDQRREIEKAFSFEMRGMARDKHLVLAFDTIERLQSALDPTEARLGELGTGIEDTSSVVGWFFYQITRLPRATILLFGREAHRFEERLRSEISEANYNRQKSEGLIKMELIDLSFLEEDEVDVFFEFRAQNNLPITRLLTSVLKKSLFEFTEGNPLLLDIALQTISETGKTDTIQKILDKKGDAAEIGEVLLRAYMSHGTPERKTLLGYLTLARNGLFPELLQCLESDSYSRLEQELEFVSSLPFVKTRRILVKTPGKDSYTERKAYFLHDAMYVICDKVLLKPLQARRDCEKIVDWYDQKIAEVEQETSGEVKPSLKSSERRDDAVLDWLVESMFYRMRANPKAGYEWYLRQADYALNAVETGLEMRLRDSIAQFSVNAITNDSTSNSQKDSASSEIDKENIRILFPDFLNQFKIDSAMLWVKRLSFRGRHEAALEVGRKAAWVKELYESDPEKYCLAFADFQLWRGQALMYSGATTEAVNKYKDNIIVLKHYQLKDIKQGKLSDFEVWRIGHTKGRTYNNLGYTYWMYFGKYKPALKELNQALDYFKVTGLVEDEANTKDNMGRIHAMLWHEPASKLLIEDGLTKREERSMTYRAALSRISLANMQHRFGHSQLALDNAEKALDTFKTLNVQRGIGLARLTRAMIYRSMADTWHDLGISVETAIKYVQDAIEDLLFAQRIFKETVQEKVRYVYALNEIGSCYRTLYFLLAQDNASEEKKKGAYKNGKLYFSDAIREAEKNKYFVEELDTKQDLAVLYSRANEFNKALKELKEIREKIPLDHQFTSHQGLAKLEEGNVTDFYYKLMGQVEMLTGAIVFDRAKDQSNDATASRKAILEAMEHYAIAIAYYYQYSGVSSNTYVMATDRIYHRLRICDRDLITEIKDIYIPKWINKHRLPTDAVKSLFNAIFDMLGV